MSFLGICDWSLWHRIRCLFRMVHLWNFWSLGSCFGILGWRIWRRSRVIWRSSSSRRCWIRRHGQEKPRSQQARRWWNHSRVPSRMPRRSLRRFPCLSRSRCLSPQVRQLLLPLALQDLILPCLLQQISGNSDVSSEGDDIDNKTIWVGLILIILFGNFLSFLVPFKFKHI